MRRFWFALLALFPLTALGVQSIVIFTVQDLGTLGGDSSLGNAVNANGVVAGSSTTEEDGQENAFITGTNGALPLRSLGTLGGGSSTGQGINSNGVVVGSSLFDPNNFVQHAFISGPNGGSLTDLGTLSGSPSQASSHAYGVNGSGQVTGDSLTDGGLTHAFISAPGGGALTDLGTFGGSFSFAFGINASGQVAGYAQLPDFTNHAFLSEPNGGPLHDLGTLGGSTSFANGLNDTGQVVGRSGVASSGIHAFRSAPNGGPLSDLGTLGGSSEATAINTSGDVIGHSFTGTGDQHAFIYATRFGLLDLNNLIDPGSGWVLVDAKGINDAGQITGVGMISSAMHAYLLTPVPPSATITAITKLASGHMRVDGVGTPLQVFTVQATDDLGTSFQPVTTIMAGSDGSLTFEDAFAADFDRQFYRFVYP